jgi:hypothetical protein
MLLMKHGESFAVGKQSSNPVRIAAGTIYPVIYGGSAQALARVRLEDLRRSLQREREES